MSTESCYYCGKPTSDCTCAAGGHEQGIFFEGVYYPYEDQDGFSSGESLDDSCDGTTEELTGANSSQIVFAP
ncbi:uncharacterized protein PgNI_00592 [Pyricularia grisea]|uniref:Uncharacterized protein n=1 Tax=Pyricularia grisea TaxID=148305 RepID=A0A6P8BJH3_PYRGI|nr:uncharacterized protein PgNI_00592 [Pyricularia grisea]TLD16938.1 hypothetical protein PgNI_00592 [Pyricularia grisea]